MLEQLNIEYFKKKKKKSLYSYLIPYTNMNPRQIIDLDVRGKTVKLVEDDTELYLCDLGLGKEFLEQ